MRTRIVSQEEWAQMKGDEHPPLFPHVSPENVAVVVVEDDGGRVIASMTVLRATHFEGAWIDPKHRNAGVTRSLLRLASAVAMARGESWVFGGAADDRMRGVMGKLGAVPVPMDTYVLPIEEEPCRKQ